MTLDSSELVHNLGSGPNVWGARCGTGDERDSEMSSLGYGEAQFKHFGVHKKCFRIWMMASRSQCHKYFG